MIQIYFCVSYFKPKKFKKNTPFDNAQKLKNIHMLTKMRKNRYILCLDLDDTLIKSSKKKLNIKNVYPYIAEVKEIDSNNQVYYIYPRPFLDQFLYEMSR